MIKQKPINYGLLLISIFLYVYLGFIVKRHETLTLLVSYFSVYAIYLYVALKSNEDSTPFWMYASVLFRSLLLFSIPNLSDDFYRFIWDGRLLSSGHHPFAEIPSYYIKNQVFIEGINSELFRKLNSPDYFTIYPPLAQFIFWTSVKLSPQSIYGSVIVMKGFVLAAEIGSITVIKKLLVRYAMARSRVLLYALNPLVILELTGNIHLEAILIFFLLFSFLLLSNQKLLSSGVTFALAVCVKLVPLIFLPAILPKAGWKKVILFYFTVGMTCVVLFLPLWDTEVITGFQKSLGYYFSKFEFNASIYYLVRAWGYWYYGYNIVGSVGWKLGGICFILIMVISTRQWWYKRKQKSEMQASDITPIIKNRSQYNYFSIDHRFFLSSMFSILTYFLFTTTLHPWYITTLLAISIFTEFRFALVWTALIFLTYAGYSENGFEENLWLTALEYIVVLGYLAFEFVWKRKQLSLPVS
jgi:alpha-1,6-mannosyltransferase